MSTVATSPLPDAAHLPDNPALLKQMVAELLATVTRLRTTIDQQQAHIQSLVRLTFGRRTERVEGPTLFDLARLTHAQLHLLKMQLHPHFLFNTLNAISALVRRDADKAEHMLTRLGDLLRLTLEHAGAQEVALSQELEFVEAYLDIEQIRFGSRLTVRTQIDPEARD